MTDEEINQRIAEACGWTKSDKGWWFNADDSNGGDLFCPGYTTDLNAMHEAEQWLFAQGVDHADYGNVLQRVLRRNGDLWLFVATARQRAEAFLRTLGKWEE